MFEWINNQSWSSTRQPCKSYCKAKKFSDLSAPEEYVATTRKTRDRTDNLRYGVIFLVAWIGVLIAMVLVVRDVGILQKSLTLRDGGFLPFLLISASTILLALGLRSFYLYFQGAVPHEDQET